VYDLFEGWGGRLDTCEVSQDTEETRIVVEEYFLAHVANLLIGNESRTSRSSVMTSIIDVNTRRQFEDSLR
jgi:hypothetical protein